MKITLKQLRSIIKEEVTRSLLNEVIKDEAKEKEAIHRLSDLYDQLRNLVAPGHIDDDKPWMKDDYMRNWSKITTDIEELQKELRDSKDQKKMDDKEAAKKAAAEEKRRKEVENEDKASSERRNKQSDWLPDYTEREYY
jgi:hypothetical protein